MTTKISLFFCCIIALSGLRAQQLVRVEPASWWVGMKNPNVQLMLYGPNIAALGPAVNYKGLTIKKVSKIENPNYLFVDVQLSPQTVAGVAVFTLSKAGKVVEKLNFEILNRRPNSANRKGFDNSDVIYLIAPDRFANGNPDNDSTPNTIEKSNRNHKDGRHGGDIRGIINHLDYVKNMGFTAIWNLPLVENNQPQGGYHGYAATDFYKIDPRYGSNAEYVELSDKAHQKGLKMIMDVVLNHCGSSHWWTKDLPSKDWFNFEGKFSSTNHKREVHEDIHASQTDTKVQLDGWFVPSMPDLNQRNEFMANYLTQNVLWWIEYANIDGLRIDTYPYSDKKFLTDWSKRVMDEYPNLNMVGEEWSLKPSIVSYWQKGKKNHNGYISSLPSLFDFPLQSAVTEALNEDDKIYNKGLTKIYQTLAEDFLYANPNNLVVMPDNHDMSRFFTQVNENVNLFKMGLVFFATTRGIPQLFYGTEIGMSNPKSDAHGEIRSDFPGGWSGDVQNAFDGQNLNGQQKDLQDFTRKLLQWRKSATAIHSGKLIHFAPENGIYAYSRYDSNQKFVVILNKTNLTQTIDTQKYDEVLQNCTSLQDVMSGERFTKAVSIPAVGFRILEVK